MNNLLWLTKRLTVPSISGSHEPLIFELQPILSLDTHSPMGYELLYRGTHPEDWRGVDAALLRYLANRELDLPTLFVNVSNEGLLCERDHDFIRASQRNCLVFELSESVTGVRLNKEIASRVNDMMSCGVRFALDDFGAGRDGLERLYSMHSTAAVKVDSAFLRTCMARPDAASTLEFLLGQWKRQGIMSIAEGVETEQLLQFARRIGADMVQGWHVDKMVEQSMSIAL